MRHPHPINSYNDINFLTIGILDIIQLHSNDDINTIKIIIVFNKGLSKLINFDNTLITVACNI